MDETELQAILKQEISAAIGYMGGEISEERGRAIDLYDGAPLGNEIDGRSQVVSTDVQDVVESIMPDLMQIFGASDELARFEPEGREDEPVAEQATDYVNYIFNRDNEGFLILHDWVKDALIQKNGFVKVWWEEKDTVSSEEYSGLSGAQLAQIVNSPNVTVKEQSVRYTDEVQAWIDKLGLDIPDPEQAAEALVAAGVPPELIQQYGPMVVSWDIVVERKKDVRRCAFDNIPPEEFLFSRDARTLDDARFLAHRVKDRTVSDLIEAGYDPEQLKKIPDGTEADFSSEAQKRRRSETVVPFTQGARNTDKATRRIDVFECYFKVDYDGDGIAERRKITVAGNQYEVLRFANDKKVPEKWRGKEDNFEVADHPFETLTPIRMPHKIIGRGMADLIEDIQKQKTTVWRQLNDNMYNVNNARAAISTKVSLEDYLDNKVAAPIRVDTPMGDVAGHIVPIPTIPLGSHAFPLLEYLDTIRETRTGINRLGQGLDPDALDSTAGGINMLLGRSQQRVLLMAMVMVHMGVKRLAKKILKTINRHQDRARTIRLRNEWVEMDPRTWNADMDVTVSVGLGRGTQQQQMVAMQMMLQVTNQIVALQGGANGPLVYLHHIRNQVEKFGEAIGLRNIDSFMADLDEDESMQAAEQAKQQPNPDMLKTKMQVDQKREEADQAHQRDMTKIGVDHMLKMHEMGLEDARERASMDLEAVMKKAELVIKRKDQELKKETAVMSEANKARAADIKGNGKGATR